MDTYGSLVGDTMICPKCGSETTKGEVTGITLHYCSNEDCEVNCIESWSALKIAAWPSGHEEKVEPRTEGEK